MEAFHEIRQYPTDFRVYHKDFTDIGILAHWHDEVELIYIRSGSAEFVISDIIIHAHEGDLVFCDKHEVHYTRKHSPNTCLEFLIFDDSMISNHYQGMFLRNHLIGAEELSTYNLDKKWRDLCQTCETEVLGEDMFYKDVVSSDIRSFYYRIVRILKSRPLTETTPSKNLHLLQEFSDVLAYISDHYNEKLSLPKIAEMLGFSDSHFSRLFKKQTGIGFTKYVNYIRIANAVEMIRGGESRVVDVSLACGFESVRNFNRVFLSIAGCTPSEYAAKPVDIQLSPISTYRSSLGIDSSSTSNPTLIS